MSTPFRSTELQKASLSLALSFHQFSGIAGTVTESLWRYRKIPTTLSRQTASPRTWWKRVTTQKRIFFWEFLQLIKFDFNWPATGGDQLLIICFHSVLIICQSKSRISKIKMFESVQGCWVLLYILSPNFHSGRAPENCRQLLADCITRRRRDVADREQLHEPPAPMPLRTLFPAHMSFAKEYLTMLTQLTCSKETS